MTPAARVAAAIELLERLETGVAADRQISSYFRQRRYAGAKDRAAVTELVYDILRRRGVLLWRLQAAKAATNPRSLVLAALVLLHGETPEAVGSWFSGDGFAAAPLSEAEQRLIVHLAEPAPGAPPAWVLGAYPPWLEPELQRRFGADLLPQMQALQERAPVDLRVNTLQGGRDQALQALAAAGIAAAPTPLSPAGLRLSKRTRLGSEFVFQSGLVEPQDEGSQLAALLVDARPGMTVVDLCAGAGGKTLALAAGMGDRGVIHACDSNDRRLARLVPRAARAGVHIVRTHVTGAAGDTILAGLAGQADRVLLDVPCSGTGTWRRQPEARWRLTEADLQRDLAQQRKLLDQAAPLVRRRGRLVYVTCSLLPCENQDQIERFLAHCPDFRRLPVREVWGEAIGGACPVAGDYLQLTPRQHGTDGFFVAVMSRIGTA